jgi:tetratricopeptide (TPR) repeat protein
VFAGKMKGERCRGETAVHSLNKACELSRDEKFEDALLEIERMENSGLMSPQLFVLKAECIQLLRGENKYSLEDVENALLAAVTEDCGYADAHIELGWFYYAVLDDAERALPFFQQAFELAKPQITAASMGIAKCLSEIKSPEQAINYLDHLQVIDAEDIQEAYNDIKANIME